VYAVCQIPMLIFGILSNQAERLLIGTRRIRKGRGEESGTKRGAGGKGQDSTGAVSHGTNESTAGMPVSREAPCDFVLTGRDARHVTLRQPKYEKVNIGGDRQIIQRKIAPAFLLNFRSANAVHLERHSPNGSLIKFDVVQYRNLTDESETIFSKSITPALCMQNQIFGASPYFCQHFTVQTGSSWKFFSGKLGVIDLLNLVSVI